jgi:eukaryotic-like serine/threonine-protein kinase
MPILTPDERIGTRIADRYRLQSILSSRGMSVLFHAEDENSGTAVVVKMPKPTDGLESDRVERFVRETRIAASLQHENIATVLDVGADGTGQPFLVMELLHGRSLEEELSARRVLPFSEALDIVIPIARALASAHRRGVVHRDVKPANIFLCCGDRSPVVPKLLDFGIARSTASAFETTTGLVVGTPSYMAPEQASGRELGPFTDIWGVGAVLYRCLAGRSPHAADSVPEVLAKLVREPVSPLSVPGVSKSASAVVDRALAKDPHGRYRDMDAFIEALTTAGGIGTTGEATDVMPAATVSFESPSFVPLTEDSNPASVADARESRRIGRFAVGAVALGAAIACVWALPPRSTALTNAATPEPRPPPRTPESISVPSPPVVETPTTDRPSPSDAPPSDRSVVAETTRRNPPARAERKRAFAPDTAVVEAPKAPPAPARSVVSEIDPRSGLPFATKW